MIEHGGFREIWAAAEKKAVAVIDCREEIPCDPCESACPRGAIVVGKNLCSLPVYDPGPCNGCGRCVAVCPGMAIYLLDRTSRDGRARITLPYEMKDEVEVGEDVWALNGEGSPLGKGKIVRTAKMDRKGHALLVTLEVPEDWALKVRGLRVRVMSVEGPREAEGLSQEGDHLLCRCEEIPLSLVREYVDLGFNALGALRRSSRAGLGYCQGRFCQAMLAEVFSAAMDRTREEAGTFRVRPPVRPVKLSRLGGENG